MARITGDFLRIAEKAVDERLANAGHSPAQIPEEVKTEFTRRVANILDLPQEFREGDEIVFAPLGWATVEAKSHPSLVLSPLPYTDMTRVHMKGRVVARNGVTLPHPADLDIGFLAQEMPPHIKLSADDNGIIFMDAEGPVDGLWKARLKDGLQPLAGKRGEISPLVGQAFLDLDTLSFRGDSTMASAVRALPAKPGSYAASPWVALKVFGETHYPRRLPQLQQS
ncbi:MAG TPA: hypothetical protein VHB73_01955 [Alphaproteobacteria bacterium]|nr:hypothetical protein [Alphaproteobacteria bacterium]